MRVWNIWQVLRTTEADSWNLWELKSSTSSTFLLHRKRVSSSGKPEHTACSWGIRFQSLQEQHQAWWMGTNSTSLAPAVPLPALRAAWACPALWGQLLVPAAPDTAWGPAGDNSEAQSTRACAGPAHLSETEHALEHFGPLNYCSILPSPYFFPSCSYCNLYNHSHFHWCKWWYILTGSHRLMWHSRPEVPMGFAHRALQAALCNNRSCTGLRRHPTCSGHRQQLEALGFSEHKGFSQVLVCQDCDNMRAYSGRTLPARIYWINLVYIISWP